MDYKKHIENRFGECLRALPVDTGLRSRHLARHLDSIGVDYV